MHNEWEFWVTTFHSQQSFYFPITAFLHTCSSSPFHLYPVCIFAFDTKAPFRSISGLQRYTMVWRSIDDFHHSSTNGPPTYLSYSNNKKYKWSQRVLLHSLVANESSCLIKTYARNLLYVKRVNKPRTNAANDLNNRYSPL